MDLTVYAFTCGWLTLPLGLLLEGEKGRLTVPVPSYLVEHPAGRLVFDSGLHTELRTDPGRRLGRLAQFHTVRFEPGEEIGARLRALGADPAGIDFLANSHLHFDHCGGNAELPNATLLLQKREWDAAHTPETIESVFYNPDDYDLGHRVRTIDGEHDVFGDGSVALFPTYGHTPGHQSMRVRIGARDVVMTGDACYLRRTLDEMHLPGAKYDAAAMIESLKRLRAMRERGAVIITGHDPETWESVPQAPAKLSFG